MLEHYAHPFLHSTVAGNLNLGPGLVMVNVFLWSMFYHAQINPAEQVDGKHWKSSSTLNFMLWNLDSRITCQVCDSIIIRTTISNIAMGS